MASLVTSNALCFRVDTNETATSELEKEHDSISATDMIMEEEEDGGTSDVSPSGTVVADTGSSLTSTTDNMFKTPQAPKVGEDVEGVSVCVCKCVCVHMYIYMHVFIYMWKHLCLSSGSKDVFCCYIIMWQIQENQGFVHVLQESHCYTWRINLSMTEQFWPGEFACMLLSEMSNLVCLKELSSKYGLRNSAFLQVTNKILEVRIETSHGGSCFTMPGSFYIQFRIIFCGRRGTNFLRSEAASLAL